MLLSIYLNDHLAGAVAGSELARRTAGSNKGTPLGDFLSSLADEIQEDRHTLESLMTDLHIRKDIVKRPAAWLVEKAGRFKLNGRLIGYSPLSRLIELEGLAAGIKTKINLWRSLQQIADPPSPIAHLNLEGLISRGEQQLADLEKWHLQAAAEALPG